MSIKDARLCLFWLLIAYCSAYSCDNNCSRLALRGMLELAILLLALFTIASLIFAANLRAVIEC